MRAFIILLKLTIWKCFREILCIANFKIVQNLLVPNLCTVHIIFLLTLNKCRLDFREIRYGANYFKLSGCPTLNELNKQITTAWPKNIFWYLLEMKFLVER